MMDRAQFLRGCLVGLGLAAAPEPLRKYFFAPEAGWKNPPEAALWGIPYHESRAEAGWLGLNRASYPEIYALARGGGKSSHLRVYLEGLRKQREFWQGDVFVPIHPSNEKLARSLFPGEVREIPRRRGVHF